MKFSKILLLMTVVFFANCHIAYDNLNFLDDADEIIPLEREEAKSLLQVGGDSLVYIDGEKAYNSFQNKFSTDQCFKVKEPTIESSSSEIQFNSSFDRSRLYHYFKFSLDLSFAGFSGSLGFEEEFQEHKLTSWQFYMIRTTRSRKINYGGHFENMLSDNGKDILEESRRKNNDYFLKQCGDQKVTRVQEGGLLIVAAKIDFESVYYRRVFQMGFSAGISMVKLAVDLQSIFERLHIKGKLSFKAVQYGGNKAEYHKLFPKDKTEACAAAVDPFNKNRSQSIKACDNLVEEFDKYKSNFLSQFNESNNFFNFNFESVYVLDDLELEPNVGKFNYDLLKRQKKKARKFFEVNEYYLKGLNDIANDYVFKDKLNPDFLGKFYNLLEILNLNKEKLLGNHDTPVFNFKFNNCWDTPLKCTEDNFEKAYNDLNSNVFREVDVLLEPLKIVYDVKIVVNHANVGAMPEVVFFKVFPIGHKDKCELLHVGGTLGQKGLTGGWELDSYSCTKYNQFWVRYKYDVSINVSPARNPLQIYVQCNKVRCNDQLVQEVTNPFYIQPMKLTE